jgi:hypothetical protein
MQCTKNAAMPSLTAQEDARALAHTCLLGSTCCSPHHAPLTMSPPPDPPSDPRPMERQVQDLVQITHKLGKDVLHDPTLNKGGRARVQARVMRRA